MATTLLFCFCFFVCVMWYCVYYFIDVRLSHHNKRLLAYLLTNPNTNSLFRYRILCWRISYSYVLALVQDYRLLSHSTAEFTSRTSDVSTWPSTKSSTKRLLKFWIVTFTNVLTTDSANKLLHTSIDNHQNHLVTWPSLCKLNVNFNSGVDGFSDTNTTLSLFAIFYAI